MGGCFSSHTIRRRRHANGMLKKPRKLRIRRGGKKKRGARTQWPSNINPPTSPSISGCAEEMWFEPVSLFGSETDGEEYHTVPDVENVYDGEPSLSKFPSPRDAMNDKYQNLNIHQHQTLSNGYEVESDSLWVQDYSSHKRSSTEKRRSSIPSARKKAVPGHPYKTTDEQSDAALFSPGILRKRPVAGSQVPICPIGKEVFDSWSPIKPSTFRVRGINYLRDKMKERASNNAAYYPFGVDIYLSQRKIKHIARLVELPAISSNPKLPALLIVNVQIPLYPPTIFQNETDGEGINVIMYFKLSERFEKDVPLHFQESIRRLINNEVEKIKGFQKDTNVPFRQRLKILSRVSNLDVLQLSAPQRKLMHAYNEKPFLSRPQHEFYLGENYFEIDIDMHRFSYISRKGFDAFRDKLKFCVLDVGLTIQGNKVEELPEQVLCCLRVNGIDHTNFQQLEPCEDIL